MRPRAGPEPADAPPAGACVDATRPGCAVARRPAGSAPRRSAARTRPGCVAGDRPQCCSGAGRRRRRRGGLRRQHRLRQARIDAHRHRGSRHTAAQPDPLAQRRCRRADGARRGAADSRAEGRQPRTWALGRAARGRACVARRLQRRHRAFHSQPGFGGGVRRSGTAVAHDAGPDGRGRMRGRWRTPSRGRSAALGRPGAAGAAGQGRVGAHQRHAGLHCAGAACAVRVRTGARGRAGDRRADGGCRAGQ